MLKKVFTGIRQKGQAKSSEFGLIELLNRNRTLRDWLYCSQIKFQIFELGLTAVIIEFSKYRAWAYYGTN